MELNCPDAALRWKQEPNSLLQVKIVLEGVEE